MKGSRMNRGLRVALLSGALLALAAPTAHATLSWGQTTHDFGTHNPGTAAPTKTFTLTATCDEELVVVTPTGACNPTSAIHNFGQPQVTGAGFTLAMPNTCLVGVLVTAAFPSTQTCQTAVAFTPPSSGPHAGALNLPSGPDIALTGTGASASQGVAGAKGKKCKKKGKKRSAGAAKKKKCKKKKKK